jgi:antitoxin (DNA-binding transcriptional repressor) of toxin-antitoxin stability system
MQKLGVTELRTTLWRLEKLLGQDSEIIVTRRGRAIARIVAMRGIAPLAELRAISPRMKVPSQVLVRQDRDERGSSASTAPFI